MIAPGWEIALLIVMGLEFGSFANVCIYRWPRGQSILFPRRSQCPWCQHLISWYDNIPVISFLFLRGKCRACHSSISWRYPFIEILLPILWLTFYQAVRANGFQLPPATWVLVCFLIFIMLVTTGTDWDWKIIPDPASYSLLVAGLVLAPWNILLDSSAALGRIEPALVGGLVGGGVLWLIAWGGRTLLGKEVMGMGDVKLLAGMGTVLGWQGAVLTLFFACFIGGLVALAGLFSGFLKRHQYIPFGPFLNIAGFLTLLHFIIHEIFVPGFLLDGGSFWKF